MKNIFVEHRKKVNAYLSKHQKTKIVVEYLNSLAITLFAALLFAFTFKIFQSPNVENSLILISGGSAGIARTIALAFSMGLNDYSSSTSTLVYSVAYAVINIPIIILAFRKIGLRFAIFTTVNVAATSLLTNFVNFGFIDELARQIACVIEYPEGSGMIIQAGLLTRAILAGIFSGVASSVSFACGGSSGGVDTVSYYFSMRKSTNIGHYSIVINAVIFGAFALLNGFSQVQLNMDVGSAIANSIVILLFVTIFSFISAAVIDLITRTNKKEQIQIITKVENLSKLLLANIPHGATIVRSKGAFTGEDRIIIYVIVSTYETPQVIKLVREADPNSFINVTSVKQVYGRFAKRKVK